MKRKFMGKTSSLQCDITVSAARLHSFFNRSITQLISSSNFFIAIKTKEQEKESLARSLKIRHAAYPAQNNIPRRQAYYNTMGTQDKSESQGEEKTSLLPLQKTTFRSFFLCLFLRRICGLLPQGSAGRRETASSGLSCGTELAPPPETRAFLARSAAA